MRPLSPDRQPVRWRYLEQLPSVDLILAPVSGGGLLSGTGAAVKLTAPAVQVWGAEPELAADAKESFEAGRLIRWPAEKTTRTIGDGLRTQSLGALNFEHVMAYVDGIVAVTEDEILLAMRVMLATTKLVPEPSGAVALAAASTCSRASTCAQDGHRVERRKSGAGVAKGLLERH